MFIMEPPHKYTLISSYKVLIGEDKYTTFNFYKYTGVYLFTANSVHYRKWNYFDSKETCLKSINALKTRFYAKKRRFSKNKKFNIELSDDSCTFGCIGCDAHLGLRSDLWDKDDGWMSCEEHGVKLKTDLTYTFHWRDSSKCEFDENEYLKSVDEFIDYVKTRVIMDFDVGMYSCDNCEKLLSQTDIYFCKKCLENYELNERIPTDDKRCDNKTNVYNLCSECKTPENICYHMADKDNEGGHECFVLLPPYDLSKTMRSVN